MKYDQATYGGPPASGAAISGKSPTTLIVVFIVLTVAFAGALAIALGVGLGVGLRTSSPPITSLSAPVVNCDVDSSYCGCARTKPSFAPRLINGQTAVPNSWPWVVYLIMNSTKVCTGFLISTRHVLTAASCIRIYGTNITVTYGATLFQSPVGITNVSSTNFTPDAYDSVAIVTLGTNLTYSANVRPCCLSSDPTEPFIGEKAVVAGWGETSTTSNSTPATNLQQAVVQVLSPTYCGSASLTSQICAGFDSISACPIDTGAPLMTSYNNAWTCVGIVSGLTPNCNSPITFTRIDAYQAFIRNVTGVIF